MHVFMISFTKHVSLTISFAAGIHKIYPVRIEIDRVLFFLFDHSKPSIRGSGFNLFSTFVDFHGICEDGFADYTMIKHANRKMWG